MDVVAGHGGIAQRRVRATIGQVGGYWRPLAGAVRLLEELGELADKQLLRSTPAREVALELADLWIITTALADQFLVDVPEPRTAAGPRGRDIARLVAAAGPIARVVNYYDGPKSPRDLEQLPSLKTAVAAFHDELALCAGIRGVDLNAVVHEKLEAIATRDSRRFERSYNDPSTERCIDELRSICSDPSRSNLVGARLWGSHVSPAGAAGDDLSDLASSLRAFARAAPRERLDGYVIGGPESLAAGDRDNWLTLLLERLSVYDPTRGRALEHIDADGRFSFEGLIMTAESFLPPHPVGRASVRPFGLLRPGHDPGP